MSKRVTFVNTNQIKPAIAPIAFDYLSGPVQRAGFSMTLLDLCFSDDWEAAIAEHARAEAPDYWAVTLRNTDDVYFGSGCSFLDRIRDIVAALRRARAVPVVMGGAGFSVMPEKLLEFLGADFGIVREGEFTFPELLTCLEDGRGFLHIPGLVYREGETIRATLLAPNDCGPLQHIGPHQRTLVDNERYFAKGGQIGIEMHGQHDDLAVDPLGPQARQDVQSVRSRRHGDVRHDDFRTQLPGGFEKRCAVGDARHDVEVVIGEQSRQALPDDRVVVSDEHGVTAFRGRRFSHAHVPIPEVLGPNLH